MKRCHLGGPQSRAMTAEVAFSVAATPNGMDVIDLFKQYGGNTSTALLILSEATTAITDISNGVSPQLAIERAVANGGTIYGSTLLTEFIVTGGALGFFGAEGGTGAGRWGMEAGMVAGLAIGIGVTTYLESHPLVQYPSGH